MPDQSPKVGAINADQTACHWHTGKRFVHKACMGQAVPSAQVHSSMADHCAICCP